MTVECVTIATNHLFEGNALLEQFRLRYHSIIARQDWDVPQYKQMEYDQYDNPATTYLIWRDSTGVARGVARLYPTDRPFMLKEVFSHLVQQTIPVGNTIVEGSRFCIDKHLAKDQRERVAYELILAYLEYGLDHGISKIIGIMHPIYWRNLFSNHGWHPVWLGEEIIVGDGKKARAGYVDVSEIAMRQVRQSTGINKPVLIYKMEKESNNVKAA